MALSVVEPEPKASELSSVAVALVPIAIEFTPVVLELVPTAIEASPVAVAPVPIAISFAACAWMNGRETKEQETINNALILRTKNPLSKRSNLKAHLIKE